MDADGWRIEARVMREIRPDGYPRMELETRTTRRRLWLDRGEPWVYVDSGDNCQPGSAGPQVADLRGACDETHNAAPCPGCGLRRCLDAEWGLCVKCGQERRERARLGTDLVDDIPEAGEHSEGPSCASSLVRALAGVPRIGDVLESENPSTLQWESVRVEGARISDCSFVVRTLDGLSGWRVAFGGMKWRWPARECVGYEQGCACKVCLSKSRKCARKGCAVERMWGGRFCKGHQACASSVSCDNLTAVPPACGLCGDTGKVFCELNLSMEPCPRGCAVPVATAISEEAEQPNDKQGRDWEFEWEALAECPDLDPRTVAACKILRDLEVAR